MNSKKQLQNLPELEKRFLSRRYCAWCEIGLDKPHCGAFYGKCSDQSRVNRRIECLKTYKPRTRKPQ